MDNIRKNRPDTNYRRQINLLSGEEFSKFLKIMNIDVYRLHSVYLDQQKVKAADLIYTGYFRLRNNEEQFRKFDSMVINALYEATFG